MEPVIVKRRHHDEVELPAAGSCSQGEAPQPPSLPDVAASKQHRQRKRSHPPPSSSSGQRFLTTAPRRPLSRRVTRSPTPPISPPLRSSVPRSTGDPFSPSYRCRRPPPIITADATVNLVPSSLSPRGTAANPSLVAPPAAPRGPRSRLVGPVFFFGDDERTGQTSRWTSSSAPALASSSSSLSSASSSSSTVTGTTVFSSTDTASSSSNTPTSVMALDPIFGVHVYNLAGSSSVSSTHDSSFEANSFNLRDCYTAQEDASASSWRSWMHRPGGSPSNRTET